ncbi:glutamate synthase domain-containing protein 2 [Marinobacterium sp. MBR-111]|jgi:glutamate synthase domain-containing protein 2|uniref:Glutamate synthase domain-containing protein 2 n=1 Tax=Marinobacterium iners DSM 11526 TaxID=1122198 RepID=A0A1H4GVT7_9GAMM|nr:FMN-binding glutamate synthase family protein [Marinobacterium iners]SEB13663.1 Glutamate synthase domain-containing protein 2 [Marinobacterium iners DSM 11526]
MNETIFMLAIDFIALIGVVVLLLIVVLLIVGVIMYQIDKRQTAHTIRRNYPLLGRFRYLFETLGEFLRQYFFAMDREEMPFNRAQRSWVYRAAKNIDNTVAFGSTRDLRKPGTYYFLNCPFPTLSEDAASTQPMRIGPYCRQPYDAPSFLNISGMSFGALSAPAVQALSMGAAKAGCWMNTGEGALSKHHLTGGCDIVFQIGTAKYGVRNEQGRLDDARLAKMAAIEQVKMFEIKLSQGAKPGKGGILPGDKVTAEIAEARGIPEGQASISPNRHPEISSIDDLLDFIAHVREVTGKPVGFKLVLGSTDWLDAFCEAVSNRGSESAPDFITLDSADGGTGAAPMPLMDSVGLPLRESLPLLVNKLIQHNLRNRVRVIASGKLINPTDVAAAICLGADFVVTARGFMFALGCIQALQCNKNSCPTGITTHNPKLHKGLVPDVKAERVANFHHNLVHEVEMIAHACGVSEPRQLTREHAAVVVDGGGSVPLNILYPRS